MTQFSLFGAEATGPTLGDLDGILLAGGQWVRSGAGARLSVVVDAQWRADALAAVFAELGVGGDDAVVPAAVGLGVRTAFSPSCCRTPRAGRAAPTRDCRPGSPSAAAGLRLWALASGRRDEGGYLLATSDDVPARRRRGAAVAARRRGGVADRARPPRLAGHVGAPAAAAGRAARRAAARSRGALARPGRPLTSSPPAEVAGARWRRAPPVMARSCDQ